MQDKVEVTQGDIDRARSWWEASDELRLADAGKLAVAFAHHREQATASLREERDSLRAKLDGTLSDEAVERAAEACWQDEFARATGRARLVPWSEAGEGEHNRWRRIARAALSSVLDSNLHKTQNASALG